MSIALKRKASRLRNTGYALLGKHLTPRGHELRRPVFIVGTGRCGTSLLVRVLQSHWNIAVFPGEANDLWHPRSYPYSDRSIETPTITEDAKRFCDISVTSWPRGHGVSIVNALSAHAFLAGSSRTLVVKSAMISFMIPQILSLFPDARLIHIYRNGPSVVESLVKKNWQKAAPRYSRRSTYYVHCAKYWNDCITEIERVRSVLSLDEQGVLLEVSYEELCATPDSVLWTVARFLDVPADGFSFDLSTIASRNYKVGDCHADDRWRELLDIMSEGMRSKGYSTT